MHHTKGVCHHSTAKQVQQFNCPARSVLSTIALVTTSIMAELAPKSDNADRLSCDSEINPGTLDIPEEILSTVDDCIFGM